MFSEYIFTFSSTAELIGLCSQPQSIQKNKKAKKFTSWEEKYNNHFGRKRLKLSLWVVQLWHLNAGVVSIYSFYELSCLWKRA